MLEQFFSKAYLVPFAFSIIRMSTPLIYCAMGALISKQAGSINMAMEGIMLTAALTSVIFSSITQTIIGGLIGAMIGGMLISFLLAYMHLIKKAELFLTGIALNMMAGGGTIFILFALTGEKGTSRTMPSLQVPNWDIPLIKDIPIIGEIFSGHNCLTYVAFLFVILTYILVFKTKTGLRIRAVGFNPHAAESVGINVNKIKFQAFLYSGVFASLGGAFMSMGYLSYFAQNMISGRGFIGISAANLADGNALGTFLAALGFGAANALSITLQTLNLRPELVQMVPYLATVIGLIILSMNKQIKANKKREGK